MMNTEHSGASSNLIAAAEGLTAANSLAAELTVAQPSPDLPEWLRELYPFDPCSLPIGEERISYVEQGGDSSPVLVLLHGNPGWSFTFRHLIGELHERYRVLAPDLVGFGLSSKPLDPAYHTLSRHIEYLATFIDRLQLRNIAFLLQGWGGPIGLAYAAAHPENVSRLVLTNTWGFPLPHAQHIRLPYGVRLAEAGGLRGWMASALGWATTSALRAGMAKPASDLVIEGYKYPYQDAGARVAARCFWRMLKHPDSETLASLREVEAGMKKIAAPVDIIWGRLDRMLSKLPAYLLRDSLKKSREPILLEDAGHLVSEDAPDVLVAKLLEHPGQKPAAPVGLKVLS